MEIPWRTLSLIFRPSSMKIRMIKPRKTNGLMKTKRMAVNEKLKRMR